MWLYRRHVLTCTSNEATPEHHQMSDMLVCCDQAQCHLSATRLSKSRYSGCWVLELYISVPSQYRDKCDMEKETHCGARHPVIFPADSSSLLGIARVGEQPGSTCDNGKSLSACPNTNVFDGTAHYWSACGLGMGYLSVGTATLLPSEHGQDLSFLRRTQPLTSYHVILSTTCSLDIPLFLTYSTSSPCVVLSAVLSTSRHMNVYR